METLTIVSKFGNLAANALRNDARLRALKQLTNSNRVKLMFIDLEEAGQQPDLVSDPFIYLHYNLSYGAFSHFRKYIPSKRVIVIDEMPFYIPDVSNITCNIERCMLHTVQYLKAAGRTRLAAVGMCRIHTRSQILIPYLMQYGASHHMSITDADIYGLDANVEDATAAFLDNIKQYNAVLCINDATALYVMQKAKEKGIRIPEDLYVIGFGDTDVARKTSPSLTSWSMEKKTCGAQIFYLYKYLLKHTDIRETNVLLTSRLIIGGSTDFSPLPPLFDAYTPSSSAASPLKVPAPDLSCNIHSVFNAINRMLQKCSSEDYAILYSLKSGKSTTEIANALYMSPRTVSYKINKILEECNVKTRKQLLDLLCQFNL